MAFNVTKTTQDLVSQISIEPNLIVEIEGVELIMAVSPVLELIRWDNNVNWDQDNSFWDGLTEKEGSRDLIDFSGTTKNILNQIFIDRGGSSSAATMIVKIVNKNGEISKAFSFNSITEILGKKCNLYLNHKDGSHPEDSMPIFRGFIDDYADDPVSIYLGVSHSENHKRQSFLEQYTSETTTAVRYKDLIEQDIYFNQVNKQKTTLSIEYINGLSLTATISGEVITVTLPADPNLRKAKDIVGKLRENSEISYLTGIELNGDGENPQVATPLKSFLIDTVVNVQDVGIFFPSQDIITSYIRINDEIMLVNSILNDTQLSVTRSELTSFPDAHEAGDTVTSLYKIDGLPVEMALKIMMSEDGNEFYESSDAIEAFNYVSDNEEILNAIIFSNVNIEDHTGLTENDLLEIGSSISNDGFYTVDSFGILEDGRSYIITKESLVTENLSTPTISYKSKYDTLITGLGMQPNEVDVSGFESIDILYGPNFVGYSFEIEETIDSAKDFIDKLLFDQNIYSIPRKARVSGKYVSPPLSIDDTPLLDINNVVNMSKLKPKRSIHKYFYNNAAYVFGKDTISGKYKSSRLYVENDSFNRIKKVGKRQFKVQSDGFTRSTETDLIIDRLSRRVLDRYRFAAKYIQNVQVLYKTGYRLEIGDSILFGGENTKHVNSETGERDFPIKSYEIINKKIGLMDGKIVLDILETGYSTKGSRFGVISPSSLVSSGTLTSIVLKKFLDFGEYKKERDKWNELIGAKIVIRNEDFSYYEQTEILGFSGSNDEEIFIKDIPIIPSEDFIIEIDDYDNQPIVSEVTDKIKLKYTFLMEQQYVTASIDNVSFQANIGGLVEGQEILIHSEDFSNDSARVKILSIVGNIITLTESIGFIPNINDKIETTSFASDFGDGYFYL